MFRRIVLGIISLSVLSVVIFAATSTPNNLRVKVDAHNYLLASGTAQTNPVTTCTFSNCRLATDASGNLLVVLAAGGTPSFTSITTPLVIGGTTASSTLTLESTSGTGTTDAIIFKTGSQAEAARFNTSGYFGIGGTPSFPLSVIRNNPTFGADTVVRFQNDDTSATGQMGFDLFSGNVFLRALIKNQNFSTGAIVSLQANSTLNNADLSLGAVNVDAWRIKAGSSAGAPLGNLYGGTNNQYDIGDAASTGRPRTIYLGTSVVAPLHVSTGTGLSVANVGANSCGTTAASIAGGSNAFVITVGATSGTQCRVAFPTAATTEYDCAANDDTTTVAVRTTPIDSTHTDLIGTFTAGDKVTGICFPR